MTNKIYDFLPAHLRNSELETIFDATLERAFAKGNMQKEKSFLGRREKGIYSDKDVYMSFPEHLFQRDNYGLEPVFSNTVIGDNIFYEDLLNAMFNKGMLTNDHRRLFSSKTQTVNLPIDADKFANWSLYYWVKPGFFTEGEQESVHKHYVTIDESEGNWWGENNAWYHYEDIREYITPENRDLIEQASRPIIEFDSGLEVANPDVTEWELPIFTCSDGNDYNIFKYVTNDLFPLDTELGFRPKVKSEDYYSEYVFMIDIPENVQFDGSENYLYVDCEFDYRNLRHEVGTGTFDRVDLTQAAKNQNSIDVYVDGIKQIGNYSYADSVVEFDEAITGYVYIDYATEDNVVTDGDNVWQRIDPAIEYNVDNETHSLKEMSYSMVYEHMVRLIETTDGLTGEPNGVNNFRNCGDNTDKTRFNNLGSVLVKNSIDIKKAYFAITRNDYDPVKAVEFLSTSYSNYKNKLTTVVRDILSDTGSDTKTTTQILEQAISEISLAKRSSINIFDGTDMINFGDPLSHYTEIEVEVVPGTRFQQLTGQTDIVYSENFSVYLNGKLQKNITDYELRDNEIVFSEYELQTGDTLEARYFEKKQETYIPPSSTKLGINALYIPRLVSDSGYTPSVEMIVGHDGSLVPAWGDRTDDILIEFETLIYNRLAENATTVIKHFDYGMYRDASEEFSIAEKKYTQYPFFKKWMIRNNIDNLYNESFDPDDWKTWNYRSVNELSPGHWRGIFQYVYGTDNPIAEPWVTVGYSQKPFNFDIHGTDYTNDAFWENLKSAYNKDWPVPVDFTGTLRTIDDLFFNSQISLSSVTNLDQDWEFGDGSPVEMAWRRSSEFAFAEFLLMILTKPFEVLDNYAEQIDTIISYYHDKEGIKTSDINKQREQYEFKLGSKLGGFVNNFKLLSENSGLSNSRYTDIPKDNYDLFVHAGEPNRSESFSAVVIEKVSIDKSHPTYDMNDTANYTAGDVVLNPYDKKYYKRKTTSESVKESNNTIKFDYSMWTLISQPNIREFGYRIHGYDDLNPTFFTMDWDKTSGEKVWSTDGDLANINGWQSGEYYRQDSYTVYNNMPYVSLKAHTASSLFDSDIKNWKLLTEWPRDNQVSAYGYKETLLDQIKSYNYGSILKTRDEVAHLMVGYQAYLQAVGWDFTDTDEDNRVVDFEVLLEKFLDWSSEVHVPGDFITLTPILTSGSFDTPYGVATVGRETNKNFYRVVDENGKQLPDRDIKFNSVGSKIVWESKIPVYGIKLDVADIEQAFVVDRVDSYGDVIYDPFSHNRNLRMIVDCNRTVDWDGTLSADGYLVYNNDLTPNLETMIEETRHYRDTLVDQGLLNINNLKSNQLGYSPRTYLTNHGVERESQLEFYKGFLSGKSTVSSINRIVNFNSNFSDVKHRDIWAIKLAEYGKLDNNITVSSSVSTTDIVSDPHTVNFVMDKGIPSMDTRKTVAIKTSGYVDPKDVNYVVQDADILKSSTLPYFEGDLAWVRFDTDREWDVRRLSEVAEIAFIGETSDGQLKVALTNEIDTKNTSYLKIINGNVDPEIQGNYYFVAEDSYVANNITVYEYLVFDQSYEPLIVEIDSTTDNSVYVPTPGEIGVEAIGFISNPTINDGDVLVIDGETFTYESGTVSTSAGISIGGAEATVDPIVSEGEQVRITVYGDDGLVQNNNTIVTFSGTNALALNSVISNAGDKIQINGETLEIDYSEVQSIRTETTATTSDNITSGTELIIQVNGNSDNVQVEDIVVTSNIANPTVDENKTVRINGLSILLEVPDPITGNNETEVQTDVATDVNSITLATDMTNFLPGDITVDNRVDAPYVLTTSDYTYANDVITFNTPITDGQVDDDNDPLTPDVDQDELVDITVELIAQPVNQVLEAQDIVNTINASGISVSVGLDNSGFITVTSSDAELLMTGDSLIDMGFGSSLVRVNKLENIAEDINSLSDVESFVSAGRLVILTDSDEMTLSGSAFNQLGFPSNTYVSSTAPTAISIASQIAALNITNITATTIGGRLKISCNAPLIEISEDPSTPGAMLRLGYPTDTITVNSIDSILEDINSALVGLPNTNATKVNRRVLITSDESSIVINDITGNAWSDLGIPVGTYSNTNTFSTSAVEFKDQINTQSENITVNISSDGRMIFTSNNTEMNFNDTEQSVLDAIGLYNDYTSVTSNADFKVMRWKSVRFTPDYNGDDFDEFYEDLGLNDTSLIWADDYLNNGWAVIDRDNVGAWTIKQRQATPVNTDYVNRVIAKSGDTYYNYQLFDPINFKISGSIAKEIDYVDWNDPAKYDITMNSDMWLSENLGKIWWDTETARYYKYDDYGDANGNVDINYAKRFWGKIVPGSKISIKQWVSSEKLPAGVSNFNTELYFDSIKNKTVKKYYYWTEKGEDPRYDKELSIEEISMMIASPTTVNKFFPVDSNTIIISNNEQIITDDTVTYSIDYRINNNKESRHTDWELVSRKSKVTLDDKVLDDFKNSIANSKIEHYEQFESDGTRLFSYEWIGDNSLSNDSLVITINNIPVDDFSVNVGEVTLGYNVELMDGDVIRIYNLSEFDSWFANISDARGNFSSSIHDVLSGNMLRTEFPMYDDYIALDTGIFNTSDWCYSDDYKSIEKFEYLSSTRNIDIISLYNSGVSSFKIELVDENGNDYDEYYFPINNEIRLVNRTNAVLDLNFNTELTPNQISVQIHELMNMLYEYADVSEIKSIFFDMIEYMYTEKTYPDWIFKTSYIDLTMFNKPLRQYAIYQRDTYQDTIDYVMETKPYHTKIRTTERIYPKDETVSANVDALHHMQITKYFGEHSRYTVDAIDGGDYDDQYPENFDVIADGTYEPGSLLRNYNHITDQAGGFDTGQFTASFLDAVITKADTYTGPIVDEDGIPIDGHNETIDKTEFYVYDKLGRGYHIPVIDHGTISSFDGSTLVVNQASKFKSASGKTVRLIAIENNNGDIEFMLYDSKKGSNLSISDRTVYNGLGGEHTDGDTILVLGTPEQIYSHEDA